MHLCVQGNFQSWVLSQEFVFLKRNPTFMKTIKRASPFQKYTCNNAILMGWDTSLSSQKVFQLSEKNLTRKDDHEPEVLPEKCREHSGAQQSTVAWRSSTLVCVAPLHLPFTQQGTLLLRLL